MKPSHRAAFLIALILMSLVIGIGYAELSPNPTILGDVTLDAPRFDVYITNVTPETSGGVTVTNYFQTTFP